VLTFAGRGQQGFIDAGASDALFTAPWVLAFGGTASLYIGDSGDQRIRKIDMASKQVTTVTGSGVSGFQNGIGRSATFSAIRGIAVDSAGNLYVSDGGTNHLIRKVDLTDPGNPNVTTFAGSQGTAGSTNGPAASASFSNPYGVVIKGSVLYVADAGNRVIRAIDLNSRIVSTAAGNGQQGSGNGPGSVAQFDTPAALALDKGGNLIVTDVGNHNIRRVSLSDGNFTVTTIAGVGVAGYTNGTGSGSAFDTPDGAVVGADGALYVSDKNNHAIRRIDLNDANFTTTTYAGGPPAGYQDAQGSNARFSNPGGLAALGNTVYVADPGNARVRVIQ
jgi:sugar lactone lactonase YvrE